MLKRFGFLISLFLAIGFLGDPVARAADEPGDTAGRITLHARDDVWFTVRDTAADRTEAATMLNSGQSYQVPDRPNLVLLVGNAALMDIEVDGTRIGPLGAQGQIVRDVRLDANALLDGTAKR